MTSYEKLKSLENTELHLKPGITFKELDNTAYAMSHTDYAKQMNKAKEQMKKEIFRGGTLSTRDN